MIYCDWCGGRMCQVGRARTGWYRGLASVWLCEDCDHERELVPPDYVSYADARNTMRCTICGDSYTWNMPVRIQVWLAGTDAYMWSHYGCRAWRDEWREALLQALVARGASLDQQQDPPGPAGNDSPGLVE